MERSVRGRGRLADIAFPMSEPHSEIARAGRLGPKATSVTDIRGSDLAPSGKKVGRLGFGEQVDVHRPLCLTETESPAFFPHSN